MSQHAQITLFYILSSSLFTVTVKFYAISYADDKVLFSKMKNKSTTLNLKKKVCVKFEIAHDSKNLDYSLLGFEITYLGMVATTF